MAVQTHPRTSKNENGYVSASISGDVPTPSWFGTNTVQIWQTDGTYLTRKFEGSRGSSKVGISQGTPVEYNLAHVNVLDDITSAKWIEIKSTIVRDYKRLSNNINSDSVFTAVVSADITADGFNNLRSFTNWYNSISQAVVNNDVTAKNFNQIVDALNLHGKEACTCNCNYCSCNCNYCTCACNHCNCQCAY